MAEKKLICVKQPKKAKNISEGNPYVGILIDVEGSEVDSIEDAEYFLCVNNSGSEARYNINLFEEPEPEIGPIQWGEIQELIDSFDFDNVQLEGIGAVANAAAQTLVDAGRRLIVVFDRENQAGDYAGIFAAFIADTQSNTVKQIGSVSVYYTHISCGVIQMSGVNDTYAWLRRFRNEVFGDTDDELIRPVFVKLMLLLAKAAAEELTKGFVVISTNEGQEGRAYQALNECAEITAKDDGRNPNSGNHIGVWIIKTNQ